MALVGDPSEIVATRVGRIAAYRDGGGHPSPDNRLPKNGRGTPEYSCRGRGCRKLEGLS